MHVLILGRDDRPRKLAAEEARKELGDPLAELLLLEGIFPRTASEVLTGLQEAAAPGDSLRQHRFFVVGEGSQIPHLSGAPSVERNLRFLVTCGTGPGGPDIFVSAFHPDQGTVEVMAWDRRAGGFNYYRTVGTSSAWLFAGNSRHALTAPTRDNGPFESHKSGHFLMKELRLPWVHWDSPEASIVPSVFTAQELDDHPWVARLEPGGAYTLEDDIAIPSVERWTRTRLDKLLSGDSDETPRRLLEQLLDTPTVNLMSSRTSSEAAVAGAASDVDLPDSFFVDSAALDKILGLELPPAPRVASAIYAKSLETFEVTLTDGAQFERKGDTHFAFVIPERAFEDTETIRQAVERGVITKRLVASLLMVDFPNPIFSTKRLQLLQYVPDTAAKGGADLTEQVVDAILTTPDAAQSGTAENEFSERWSAGEAFEETFNSLLQGYYSALAEQLRTQEGFDDYMRLAESRRERVKMMPIAESELLFARTNIPPRDRVMKPDATVEEL